MRLLYARRKYCGGYYLEPFTQVTGLLVDVAERWDLYVCTLCGNAVLLHDEKLSVQITPLF